MKPLKSIYHEKKKKKITRNLATGQLTKTSHESWSKSTLGKNQFAMFLTKGTVFRGYRYRVLKLVIFQSGVRPTTTSTTKEAGTKRRLIGLLRS